jgi:hypothetical protein
VDTATRIRCAGKGTVHRQIRLNSQTSFLPGLSSPSGPAEWPIDVDQGYRSRNLLTLKLRQDNDEQACSARQHKPEDMQIGDPNGQAGGEPG